jgi:monoamine oxidase
VAWTAQRIFEVWQSSDNHAVNRRRFLQQSARAAPFAAIALGARSRAIDVNPTVIVGAGLAGLRAADLLRKAGLPVVVLEAQGRAGGRVLTVRAPFDEGLHAEAGAIRFAGAHRAVLRAVRRHRLPFEPFAPAGTAVTAIDKRPATTLDGQSAWTLDLKPSERGLTPSALLEHYVGRLPADLSDPAAPASALTRWQAFDRVTWPEWLESRGASRDAVKLMTVGADSAQVSALYVIRQYAMLRTSTQRYKIAGGMDRLPGAMATALGDIVRYNAPVVRVERRSSGFRVDYREGPAVRSTIAARVVFAVPIGTMREIEVRPGLSAEKQRAFDRLSYYPAVRFMLQTKRRFWQTAGLSGSARTDRATETWDATFDRPGSRGILGATTGGDLERRLQGMTLEASVTFGVDLVADAFPAIRSEFEKGAVYRWSTDPWARGAFALYRPGQMTELLPRLAASEDGMHFAGEHTSPWTGWMEGALESGERAAREVLAAAHRAWPETADDTR